MNIPPSLEFLLGGLTPAQVEQVVADLPDDQVLELLEASKTAPLVKAAHPMAQAQVLDPAYRVRPHLAYLSERLRLAVADVESGKSRYLVVSMPPRAGKSQLCSVYLPVWLLSVHPEWEVGLISHDPSLAVKWGRDVRSLVRENVEALGIQMEPGSDAAAEWQTTEKGGVLSRSVGQSITGRGFNVLIVDDAVKDFADAHSKTKRDALWNWWDANAQTRQNGPWLVVFIGTRWHEDDLLGRIQNPEFEGDRDRWEVIKFPAIATDHDVLGRSPGEPLLSPLMEETPDQALDRWSGVKRTSGSYTWNALYQQSPSPAKGAIFDSDWWRFWTVNPANVSKSHEDGCAYGDCGCPEDGKVVLVDFDRLHSATWLDSWDMAFKDTASSDYVVGQRWAMVGANRYLMYQERKRRSFTDSVAAMTRWATDVAFSALVHLRVVEDKANGTAVINTLKDKISGIKPVSPGESKVARARAVTPECESKNVLFPFPGDPGNEWVPDLLSELRQFPNDAHDDQVDALTQALSQLRSPGRAGIGNPNKVASIQGRSRGQVARTITRRYGSFTRR